MFSSWNWNIFKKFQRVFISRKADIVPDEYRLCPDERKLEIFAAFRQFMQSSITMHMMRSWEMSAYLCYLVGWTPMWRKSRLEEREGNWRRRRLLSCLSALLIPFLPLVISKYFNTKQALARNRLMEQALPQFLCAHLDCCHHKEGRVSNLHVKKI